MQQSLYNDPSFPYDDDPLYKRVIYYSVIFMIGFLPGLITGYIVWA